MWEVKLWAKYEKAALPCGSVEQMRSNNKNARLRRLWVQVPIHTYSSSLSGSEPVTVFLPRGQNEKGAFCTL